MPHHPPIQHLTSLEHQPLPLTNLTHDILRTPSSSCTSLYSSCNSLFHSPTQRMTSLQHHPSPATNPSLYILSNPFTHQEDQKVHLSSNGNQLTTFSHHTDPLDLHTNSLNRQERQKVPLPVTMKINHTIKRFKTPN